MDRKHTETIDAIRTEATGIEAPTTAVQPAVKLSINHLMDAPLQQLVDELNVILHESTITDPAFFGYVYADRQRVVVSLPSGQSELVRDCIARYLIGRAFGVDGLLEMPDPFEAIDITRSASQATPLAKTA